MTETLQSKLASTPDYWTVFFLNGDDPHYRLAMSWKEGYTTGDTWRMNSGITRCAKDSDNLLAFSGSSGSLYYCRVGSFGLDSNLLGLYNELKSLHKDKVELIDSENPEDLVSKDWLI